MDPNRYYTVEWSSAFSHGSRYEHVKVSYGGPCATQIVMNRIKSATVARVRQITSEEYERLTR